MPQVLETMLHDWLLMCSAQLCCVLTGAFVFTRRYRRGKAWDIFGTSNAPGGSTTAALCLNNYCDAANNPGTRLSPTLYRLTAAATPGGLSTWTVSISSLNSCPCDKIFQKC